MNMLDDGNIIASVVWLLDKDFVEVVNVPLSACGFVLVFILLFPMLYAIHSL